MSDLRVEELRRLYNRCERIEASYFDMQRVADGAVIRHMPLRQHSFREGLISYTALTKQTAEAAIDAQLAAFGAAAVNFEWKVYHYDQPDDLVARLAARGFEVGTPETILVLPLAAATAVLLTPPAHSVRRLADPDELDSALQVHETLGQPSYAGLAGFLRDAMIITPDEVAIYVATVDGVVVASAWLFQRAGSAFASLWGGVTLPAYRGQGIYTALVAARVQEAARRGARFVSVDAGPFSLPILTRLGFLAIGTAQACLWRWPARA